MRLELGSGYHPTPGFTHLDLNPNAPDVDIVGPAYPLDLPDASCEELRAIDVLEHLSYRDTDAALAEWARVLMPGGKLYVQVPDADEIMRWYAAATWAMDGASLFVGGRLRERGIQCGLPRDWSLLDVAGYLLLGGHADGRAVRDGDDWRLNAHYALFNRGTLEFKFDKAGLKMESCETSAHPNLCAWAVKL